MPIYKIQNNKLKKIQEKAFDLEKDLQSLTEENLVDIFGLQFISSEFNLESFWLDTLTFDNENKSFVIIEYKKVENFSLMDQGQTYLNLVLDHKADVLLEYLERTNKPLKKQDVDWSQTRVMFIGPKFNTYQKRALSPNLPFELWEVALYEEGLIEYDQITPIGSEKKNDKIKLPVLSGTAAQEIKTYTIEDHLKKASQDVRDLFQTLREQILLLDTEIKEKPVSWYIGYQLKGYNIASVQIYAEDKIVINLMIDNPIDPEFRLKEAPKSWQKWSKVPLRRFTMTTSEDLIYAMNLVRQAYDYRKSN